MTPRLTGGQARGRRLARDVPAGVRPTSARVREALFAILGPELAGQRVLDAYGGSGLLALEAWSRGALVTVVEVDAQRLRGIRANALALRAELALRRGDALSLAERLGPFDGILADPPYAADPAPIAVCLARWATSWLVLEARSGQELPLSVGTLACGGPRRYGDTELWVYRRAAPEPPTDAG